MRNEFAVEYQYEGRWVEFSKHPSRSDAQKDADMLNGTYKVRIIELHPTAQ